MTSPWMSLVLGVDLGQQRQAEGGRFAGAGLRLRDEIAAVFEQKGDHRGLHRRGGDDAQLLQTTDHLRWNSEGGKGMGVGF
jgi:hypothetical protein